VKFADVVYGLLALTVGVVIGLILVTVVATLISG
jgi:hypothetical protein